MTDFIVARVSTDETQFIFGDKLLYSDEQYSLNPIITSLSDTTFALSYYDTVDGETVVSTRVGMYMS